MSSPVYKRSLGDELAEIRRLATDALTTAKRRAAQATIAGLVRVLDGGSITAENASGTPVVTLGSLGGGRTGAALASSGGEAVIRVVDTGLDRPYIPVPFYRTPTTAWVTISAGTPVAEFTAEVCRQHTGLTVDMFIVIDPAVTVTLDLYDHDNAVVLTSMDVPGPFNGHATVSAALSGAQMAPRGVSIRLGRAGAGAALAQVRSAFTQPVP